MQPPVAPVRNHLTAEEVTSLIQDSPALGVSAGCELLTGLDLMLLEDVTDDFVGGSVSRASFANLHGSASLSFSRDLPWPSAIVRPYITLTDGTLTARFNLGAYYTDTPKRSLMESPYGFDVQCYDILSVLADSVGDAYAVAQGVSYLTAVEAILTGRGVQKYYIDQDAAASVLPANRVWVMDDSTTWLIIVNDLLASIGYAGVWSDWDGQLRCEKYTSPRQRGPEWVYDTGLETSTLGARTAETDLYGRPNRWVFVQTNPINETAPIEGAGRYTYVNETTGVTSVDSRGRQITRIVPLDVPDHATLLSAAQVTIDSDMQVAEKITASTAPNPLHWHFDLIGLEDTALGPPTRALVSQWTLPLDGADMSQEWTVVAP